MGWPCSVLRATTPATVPAGGRDPSRCRGSGGGCLELTGQDRSGGPEQALSVSAWDGQQAWDRPWMHEISRPSGEVAAQPEAAGLGQAFLLP